jgi:tetratricopeptide (TPR) repeat protein
LVFAFGVHSLVDWTWYFPGDACVALLCAGWLAGRGPLMSKAANLVPSRQTGVNGDAALQAAQQQDTTMPSAQAPQNAPWWSGPSPRVALASAVLVISLLAAWAQWQPLRSFDAANNASALLAGNPLGARAAAQQAIARDPLSVQALFTLAAVQQSAGEGARARATLQKAVRLQPSNPQTWVALGEYDLQAHDPADALNELRAAIYLNPQTIAPEATIIDNPGLLGVRNAYLLALRETGAKQ